MQTIHVTVSWCNTNYAASVGPEVPGAVVVTADTVEELKKEVAESVQFHVEGLLSLGDDVPDWLASGDYRLECTYTPSALLRRACDYTTLRAISQVTGINQKLLSHYLNGVRCPREPQRKKIVEGLHKLGENLLAIA